MRSSKLSGGPSRVVARGQALRASTNGPEQVLWALLRGRQLGVWFRRQVPRALRRRLRRAGGRAGGGDRRRLSRLAARGRRAAGPRSRPHGVPGVAAGGGLPLGRWQATERLIGGVGPIVVASVQKLCRPDNLACILPARGLWRDRPLSPLDRSNPGRASALARHGRPLRRTARVWPHLINPAKGRDAQLEVLRELALHSRDQRCAICAAPVLGQQRVYLGRRLALQVAFDAGEQGELLLLQRRHGRAGGRGRRLRGGVGRSRHARLGDSQRSVCHGCRWRRYSHPRGHGRRRRRSRRGGFGGGLGLRGRRVFGSYGASLLSRSSGSRRGGRGKRHGSTRCARQEPPSDQRDGAGCSPPARTMMLVLHGPSASTSVTASVSLLWLPQMSVTEVSSR